MNTTKTPPIGCITSPTRVKHAAKKWHQDRSDAALIELEAALISNQYMNDHEALESVFHYTTTMGDEFVVCQFDSGIEVRIPIE